ncbi:MAG: hypothetical protein ACI9IP_002458 [Arcticibacterium sp.]|jgi:hypothetical protein
MKKLSEILTIVFVFVSVVAQAQNVELRARAGINMSTVAYSSDYEIGTIKLSPGIQLGVMAEVPIINTLSVESGLLINNKGFKMSQTEDFFDADFKAKMNLYYLDIPINAKYYYQLDGVKVFGTFGPYIGYGLVGNTSSKYTVGGESTKESEKIVWGNDSDANVKRLDYGLGLGLGLGAELEGIQFGLNYNLGLANTSASGIDSFKTSNRVLSLFAAYKIK